MRSVLPVFSSHFTRRMCQQLDRTPKKKIIIRQRDKVRNGRNTFTARLVLYWMLCSYQYELVDDARKLKDTVTIWRSHLLLGHCCESALPVWEAPKALRGHSWKKPFVEMSTS